MKIIDPILFRIFKVEELSRIYSTSLYDVKCQKKNGLYTAKPEYLLLEREEILLNMKYNMIHSTPRLLNIDSSLEFIAYLCFIPVRQLPWNSQHPFQQFVRSRKFKQFKIRVNPFNIRYLETLSLHIHYSQEETFFLTHYEDLHILKTAELPMTAIKTILESNNIQETLITHSELIRESFKVTPRATKKDFMPNPDRKLASFEPRIFSFYP